MMRNSKGPNSVVCHDRVIHEARSSDLRMIVLGSLIYDKEAEPSHYGKR